MTFESEVVPADWRTTAMVPMYKGKRERIKLKKYRDTSLQSVNGEMFVKILVDRVLKSD